MSVWYCHFYGFQSQRLEKLFFVNSLQAELCPEVVFGISLTSIKCSSVFTVDIRKDKTGIDVEAAGNSSGTGFKELMENRVLCSRTK